MKKLAIVFILLISCSGGGGGGGDDNGTSPTLNTVTAYKMTDAGWVESLWFEIGDEVNLDVFASDPDKNIKTIHMVEYYSVGGELVEWQYVDDVLPTQQGVDYHYYFLENLIVNGPAGDWRECVYLVDSKGNESNEICINTVVTN